MLNGKTVLVIEEEFLIALDIQRVLETLGAGQTLFARTVQEADAIAAQGTDIGLAIVEVRAGPAPSLELTHALVKSKVAVVLSTADVSLRRGLPQLPDIPVVLKPMAEDDLVAAIGLALAARP
ncbi:hypothetical protein [Devosia lacusdianchii]|uniref:hypothetical protein n=1 Tax=Devosia lacusdianchii TaxID=2917991 RepID=UPI001F05F239|nr:hypothetical protein [Devosia sp. JXJ CY 41]